MFAEPWFPKLADHWGITQFDSYIICEMISDIGKLNTGDPKELSCWVILGSQASESEAGYRDGEEGLGGGGL